MRWFFLHYSYEPHVPPDCGGFRKLWELAYAMKGHGEEVLLFHPDFQPPLREVSHVAFPVVQKPLLRPLSAYTASAWSAWRRRPLRPDWLYIRISLNPYPLLVKSLLHSRLIVEVNSDPVRYFENEKRPLSAALHDTWMRLLLRRSDLITTLTEGLRRKLVDAYGLEPSRVAVIPSGTDTDHFHPVPLEEAKARLGWDPKRPVVGFVGLLYRHQGVEILLQALTLLPEEVKAVVVGEGVMRKALEAMAQKLGIQSRVRFTGHVPYREVPKFLQAMDLTVAPLRSSCHEASPFKVLDALACGKIVIASDLPFMRPLFQRCPAVVPVPPEDPEALARKVIEWLPKSTRFREEARRYAVLHHSWPVIARKVLDAATAKI